MAVHTGVRPVRVEGDTRVNAVVWSDGEAEHTVPCDAVGFGYALRSETQLADLLGCRYLKPMHRAHLPERDDAGRTSVAGVYVAGDGAGIMGADAAEWAGERAALALLADHGVKVDAARATRAGQADEADAIPARAGARLSLPHRLGGPRTRCAGGVPLPLSAGELRAAAPAMPAPTR